MDFYPKKHRCVPRAWSERFFSPHELPMQQAPDWEVLQVPYHPRGALQLSEFWEICFKMDHGKHMETSKQLQLLVCLGMCKQEKYIGRFDLSCWHSRKSYSCRIDLFSKYGLAVFSYAIPVLPSSRTILFLCISFSLAVWLLKLKGECPCFASLTMGESPDGQLHMAMQSWKSVRP